MATSEARGAHYFTPKQLADELGVTPSVIYRAVERGELPAVRLLPKGAIRIPRSAVEHKVRVS